MESLENDNYKKLIEDKVGQEAFTSRFKELLDTITNFLVEGKYDKKILCNERVLYHVLLDYYSDIFRLKDFHEILHTKSDKNIAYLIYWILKRKPIQLNDTSDKEKDIFVNERFVAYMLVNECILIYPVCEVFIKSCKKENRAYT